MGPCPFARLGTPTLGGFRFPNLKDAAETHEHHGLAKSSIADEVIGQEYSTFLVGFDRKRIRIQGCCQVIVSLTEQIESVQWLGQRFKFTAWPRFDAAMLMRWSQHEVRSVVVIAGAKRGTK
jgi:hypothetical protein